MRIIHNDCELKSTNVSSDQTIAVGVDIGATAIKAALVDLQWKPGRELSPTITTNVPGPCMILYILSCSKSRRRFVESESVARALSTLPRHG